MLAAMSDSTSLGESLRADTGSGRDFSFSLKERLLCVV
jgi:hypothetical protein